MLVDVTPQYDTPEKILALPKASQELWASLSEEEKQHFMPVRIGPGVWDGGLNAESLFQEEARFHRFVESMGNLNQLIGDTRTSWEIMKEFGMLSCYGVCDGIQNLLSHPDYADVLSGPRKFTVFITEIRKADHGWRWHKWGPYIGSFNPQCEYLEHEEGIESVWIFSIVEHPSLS